MHPRIFEVEIGVNCIFSIDLIKICVTGGVTDTININKNTYSSMTR